MFIDQTWVELFSHTVLCVIFSFGVDAFIPFKSEFAAIYNGLKKIPYFRSFIFCYRFLTGDVYFLPTLLNLCKNALLWLLKLEMVSFV